MPGFLQPTSQGFLAPTGFTNYLQSYTGAYPNAQYSGGGGVQMPPAFGGIPGSPGGISIAGNGLGNRNTGGSLADGTSNLTMQQQYGGPILESLLNKLISQGNQAPQRQPIQPPTTQTPTPQPRNQVPTGMK